MSLSPILIFLFLIALLAIAASAQDALAAGTGLMATNQTITSSDRTFALGFFFHSTNSSSDRPRYYLAVWYNNLPGRPVVWVANRDAPLADPRGGATIGADGNLAVVDGDSEVVWSSGVPALRPTTRVSLEESGNLVLRDGSGRVVWQSFDFPVDTLLPGMNLRLNRTTGRVRGLVSWRSPDDPSPGDNYYGPDPMWPVQFIIARGAARRWRSTWFSNRVFSDVTTFGGDRSFAMYLTVVTSSQEMVWTVSFSDASLLWKIQLNSSGVVEIRTWAAEDNVWNVVWSRPSLPCRSYARCGPNGVCSMNNSPECTCLVGSRPRREEEWESGNWTAGCERPPSYVECNQGDGFVTMDHIKLPDLPISVGNLSAAECAQNCLMNCSCRAYAYANVSFDPSPRCVQWGVNLLDLEENFTSGQNLYIRLSRQELDQLNARSTRSNNLILILLTSLCGTMVVCIVVVYLLWRRFRSQGKGQHLVEFSTNFDSEDLPFFSFVNLQAATNNFSTANKLGEGGFGPVYKGKLPNGQEIAVKRLSQKSGQGLEEFKTEVELIAKLQHRNLVRLLGWCIHKEEKLLIYEFMPNISLDRILFESVSQVKLDWGKRFHIAEGIAQGLLYLHKHSRLTIIHRDLKTSNILLDGDMNAKISDFGMARIVGGDELGVNTKRVMGTYGYMSPEYAIHGIFSEKSDVYSFGVILLELVSGKRGTGVYPLEHSENLLGYAWTLWMNDRCVELIDPSISMSVEVAKCIHIALLCVQEVAAERPSMPSVVLMLSSENPSLPTPKEPAFYMRTSAAPSTHNSLCPSMNSTTGQSGSDSIISSTYYKGR